MRFVIKTPRLWNGIGQKKLEDFHALNGQSLEQLIIKAK
jgi:hypothetical protein